ncbi:MAG: hypothetical protein ACOYMA_08405 [Bacteroidia bacterium]
MTFCKHIFLFSFLLFGMNLFAQKDSINYGKLRCSVIDYQTKKTISNVNIIIKKNSYFRSKYTDSLGKCSFDSIESGNYLVIVNSKDYVRKFYNNIKVKKNKIKLLNHIILDKKFSKGNTDSLQSRPVLIKPDEPTQHNLNKQQIMRMPY